MPDVATRDLFLYAPAWERLREWLTLDGEAEAPLLLHADGSLSRGSRATQASPGCARVGWLSPDTFIDGYADNFLESCLTIGVEWLQSGSAGVDGPLFAKLAAAGTIITTSDATAPSIAELAIAGVLDHFQRGPERRAFRQERRWRALPFREIGGARWLIVGYGAIGRQVAARARAFGAHVTGIRRSPGEDPSADLILSPERLHDALSLADIVVLSLPLSGRTRGIADAAFFAAVKPGAVIVNVGRGGLLDEEALIAALDRGQVGHAVLDVVSQEPLPPDDSIWNRPDIALTCHVAGLGDGTIARSDALFLDNLAQYRAGRPLRLLAEAEQLGAG